MGYYDDFGSVAPKPRAEFAASFFAKFDDGLFVALKKNKPEACSILGFLGLAIGFREDYKEAIANLSLSEDRVEKLAALAGAAGSRISFGIASREIATVRFGGAALWPIHEFLYGGREHLPKKSKAQLEMVRRSLAI